MKKPAWLFILLLLTLIGLVSVYSQEKIGAGIPAVAGYDSDGFNRLFIGSSDENYRVYFGGFTQIRWNLNYRGEPLPPGPDETQTTTGFDANRTRLFVNGWCTPVYHYFFQFNIDSAGTLSLWTAQLQVKLNESWNLVGGLTSVPQSREDWMSPQDTLTTEYSPNDFTFAIGSAYGITANRTGEANRFWFGATNGTYGSKNTFPKATQDIGVYGRWENRLAGRNWSTWDDLINRRGREFGILLGIAAGYQYSLGGTGAPGTEQNGQVNIDISLNGSGFQSMVAASWTYITADPDSVNHPLEYTRNNFGLLIQFGYFAADRHQIYGQYNLVSPGIESGRFTHFNSLTMGYSFFPLVHSNRWKFSLESGYLFEALNDTLVPSAGSLGFLGSDKPGQIYARIQAQFGF